MNNYSLVILKIDGTKFPEWLVEVLKREEILSYEIKSITEKESAISNNPFTEKKR